MSIDEVMTLAHEYRVAWIPATTARDQLRASIEQHVAEAVARETERCADAAREWEDNYVIEDSAPRHVDDAIRARADHETQHKETT